VSAGETLDPEPPTAPDSAEPTDVGDAPDRPARRVRWGAVSGTVVLVYVVVWCLGLSRVANRATFNRWGSDLGSLGARLVICGVVLATLFHTFDGLRRLLPEALPRLREREDRLRAWVLFATWAIALPCFAAIVWPWIAETTR
jgi:succinate dehydrogenase/fumarate reductase cytochrome b subunit